MFLLDNRHITALEEAERLIINRDFEPYFRLKELLHNDQARDNFRRTFCSYYGLNGIGTTDEFKDRFFEILFNGEVIVNDEPSFRFILLNLADVSNRLEFSFVSKLVNIHLESSPIYDRHVRKFLGTRPPYSNIAREIRIDWYIQYIHEVRESYNTWAVDRRLIPILNRFRNRDQRLDNCHVVRLIDFLIWKVGNQRLH